MRRSRWFLLFFLLVCFTVEFLGERWTSQSVHSWYPMLIKPSWTPPTWVFGPVWTLLYALIGVSGWLVYEEREHPYRVRALIVYGAQLFLNLIWSGLFFGLHNPLLGLIDILVLWIMIVMTLLSFWQVNRLAALLLVPYLLWTTYAVTLNIALWMLNRP